MISKLSNEDLAMFEENELYMLTILLDILKYHTWSENEIIMQPYILTTLKLLNFETQVDDIGNIYAVRGTAEQYPLLNAHMDIIYSISNKAEDEIKKKLPQKETAIVTTKQIKTNKKKKKTCPNCIFFDACIDVAMKNNNITDRQSYWRLKNSKGCEQWKEDVDGYNELIIKTYDKHYVVEYENDDDDDDDVSWWRKYCRRYDDNYEYGKYSYTSYYVKTKEEKLQQDTILNDIYQIEYNPKTGKVESNEYRVLGGDDKCGIALALATAFTMQKTPMKILFTVGEESGCKGIQHFCKNNSDWFKDVKYSITIDRRGDNDLLQWSAGKKNCSKKFAAQLAFHGINAGIPIKVDNGTIADVIHIRDYVQETVNISAGYHNPHSTTEYIDFFAMCNILVWLQYIIKYVKV